MLYEIIGGAPREPLWNVMSLFYGDMSRNDVSGLLGLFVLFAPLAGALWAGVFSLQKRRLISALVPCVLLALSLLACIFLALNLPYFLSNEFRFALFDWIVAGDFWSRLDFAINPLSLAMMSVVSFVSLCVHIYAIGYMWEDRGFNRFFAFLSAFVFCMLFLVMSDNLLGLFIGWEGVGLCSYLLIGFYYERKSANFASIEAFVMNRIADLAMLLGIFLIAMEFHSVSYYDIFETLRYGEVDEGILTWICALLFVGAMGKSAQFPLHTWLADAMEGPTPVSALIHAATMVTAGVYLLLRLSGLYEGIIEVNSFIALLGAFVALFAASMALVNKDLKRIIAYSTLSQLGYMFVACGLGAYALALFHLCAHAFFKALLFLGAGNVMHAANDELNITKMGGFSKKLKITATFMTIASLALCGIYPFAGYFSKDLILESAFYTQHYGLWLMLLLGAFCTAFYSFRLLMLVFFAPSTHHFHLHEAPRFMLLAMLPLGILAVVAGFFEGWFMGFVDSMFPQFLQDSKNAPLNHASLIALTLSISALGIILAIFMYKNGAKIHTNFLHKILENQYYIPKLYEVCIIKPYAKLSAFLWEKVELKVIDFIVDFIAKGLQKMGFNQKPLQSGNLSQSMCLMVFGALCLFALMAFGYFVAKGL